MEHGTMIQIGKPFWVGRREFRHFASKEAKQEMQISMAYVLNHSDVSQHRVSLHQAAGQEVKSGQQKRPRQPSTKDSRCLPKVLPG